MGAFSPKIEEPQWWFDNSSSALQVHLVVFLSSIGAIRVVFKHFGVCKFSCQLIVGLLFGCSWQSWNAIKLQFFTADKEDALGLFVYFGYILYLFICTVKIDLVSVLKTDRKALKIGIPAFIMPFLIGYVVPIFFPNGITNEQKRMLPNLLGYHAQTAFPVIASLVSELKIVNSEVGRLALSSSLITSLLSLFMLIGSGMANGLKENPSKAAFELGGTIVLFLSIWFIFRVFMLRMLKHTAIGKSAGQSSIQGIVFFALLSTILFNSTGVSGLMGPYILGLAIPDAAPLATTLVNRAESFVMNIFTPIMVVTCGLRADLSKMPAVFDTPFSRINVIVFCVTFFTKLITCLLSSLYCKLPFKESLALSFILSSKGIVELVIYARALDKEAINHGLFGYLILGVLVVATIVPIAVRFLYDPSSKYAGFKNRNLLHLKPNSELRVLACVHRDEDVHNIIQLLNISCPTIDNPVGVYALHLIELVGRTNPILISHQLQKKTLNEGHSYSENIILSFERYEKDSNGTVHVECFTEVSPNKFMQDDICTLAFANDTSLIILPFHRTWTTDGFVSQDDNTIRTLNSMVLDKAPCSVAILANRGNFGSMTAMSPGKTCKYSVCVIFLGGNDDREAISYASRMSKDSRIELTVLRLKPVEEDESNNWEIMLNSQVIKHFKVKCVEEGTARFIEEFSKDGPETAWKIRKIVNDYDLIIVGRRHGLESPQTTGLSAWNEFPELGIIGDLIVSEDINGRASVLSIQHQMAKRS